MNPLLSAELSKLRSTRTFRLLFLTSIAVAGLLGFVTASTAGHAGDAPLGSVAHLENVVGVSAMPGFVMHIVGVLAMAGEYQHGTISQTYLAAPRRSRLLAAKLLAMAGAGAAVALAMVITAVVATIPAVVAHGASIPLGDGNVLHAVAGTVISAGLFATAGVAIGAIVRSQVAALVAIAAWVVVAEGLLSVVLGGNIARWLPGGAAAAIAGSGADPLPLWGATALLAGYCASVAAAAARITVRHDVT
jgi:ABC-2 type transport system permease protein